MDYFANTDKGSVRQNNEDSYFCKDNLFIVADGMGGHQAGEVASSRSVKEFSDYFLDKLKNGNSSIKDKLIASLKHSNEIVYSLAINDSTLYGMGTTFTACYIEDKKANIVHVGDTRFYLKRKKDLKLVTNDHTLVWELYENSVISFEEMFDHPQRNLLSRVVGTQKNLDPDHIDIDLMDGDLCLMCSDGLNSMLKDNEINDILQSDLTLKNKTDSLIEAANHKGGPDNITVILIGI